MTKRCSTTDSAFYWKLFLSSVVLFSGCSQSHSSQEKASSDQVRPHHKKIGAIIRLVADDGTEKRDEEEKFDPPDRVIAAVEEDEPKIIAAVEPKIIAAVEEDDRCGRGR